MKLRRYERLRREQRRLAAVERVVWVPTDWTRMTMTVSDAWFWVPVQGGGDQ